MVSVDDLQKVSINLIDTKITFTNNGGIGCTQSHIGSISEDVGMDHPLRKIYERKSFFVSCEYTTGTRIFWSHIAKFQNIFLCINLYKGW